MSENKKELVKETSKSPADKKRKWIIASAVFVVTAVVSAVLYYWLFVIEEQPPEPQYDKLGSYIDVEEATSKEYFDWDENIFEDEEYLSKDRRVYYSTGNETVILDVNDKRLKPGASIFPGYFEAIINGDNDKVNSYYTEAFIEDITSEEDPEKRHPYYRSLTERYTMQRLYDMKVTFVGTPYEGNTQYIWYKVEYRLARNNGTFLDILGTNMSGHDVLLRQDFYLLEDDGEYKISYVGFTVDE